LFEHVTFAVDPVEHDPAFLNRIFHLHNLKGVEPPDLLTVTPETAFMPKPSILAPFLAGASGLLPFARSKRRVALTHTTYSEARQNSLP
jgi:hypothetical protein